MRIHSCLLQAKAAPGSQLCRPSWMEARGAMGKRRRLQSRMCRRRRRRALRKAAVQPPQLQETIPRVAGRIRRALRAVSRPRWRAPSASRCTCLWRSSALRYGRIIGASCRPGMILDEAQRRCVRDPMRRGATLPQACFKSNWNEHKKSHKAPPVDEHAKTDRDRRVCPVDITLGVL